MADLRGRRQRQAGRLSPGAQYTADRSRSRTARATSATPSGLAGRRPAARGPRASLHRLRRRSAMPPAIVSKRHTSATSAHAFHDRAETRQDRRRRWRPRWSSIAGRCLRAHDPHGGDRDQGRPDQAGDGQRWTRFIRCALRRRPGACGIVIEGLRPRQCQPRGDRRNSRCAFEAGVRGRDHRRAARRGASSPIYGNGGGRDVEASGAIFAGDLQGVKARVLLSVLLAAEPPVDLAATIRAFGG